EFWEGNTEHRSGAYLDVREHSSTGSTYPKTDFEEFGKRSNDKKFVCSLCGATSAASSFKTQPDTVSSSVDNYILISPGSQEFFLSESRSTSRKNPGFHVRNV
ncbi:MAG: palindromic element RPE1 domain-containing protein, partial [Holosporales bacterium]|nr:palindromic element RPE1 domain-containing protein [Holosporales bacterium]